MLLVQALREGALRPTRALYQRLYSCALCGACDATCPVGLEPTRWLYEARAALRGQNRRHLLLAALLKAALRRPALSFRLGRLSGGRLLFGPLKGVELPASPLREGQVLLSPERPKGRVAVFSGCLSTYVLPQVGQALVGLLQALRYEVLLPGGELCCSAPLRGLGLAQEAAEFARRNSALLRALQVEAVLSPCPTCTLALRKQYPHMGVQPVEQAQDALGFLLRQTKEGLDLSAWEGQELSWHEPCHSYWGLGLRGLARALRLKVRLPGQLCCGLPLSITAPELSQRLLGELRRAHEGAHLVLSPCPGCLLQLRRAGLRAQHPLELLAQAYLV
jgi:glycolate oxidase iron-sulfur subunit